MRVSDGSDYVPPNPDIGNKCPRRILAIGCDADCSLDPSSCEKFLMGAGAGHNFVGTNEGTPRDPEDKTVHHIYTTDRGQYNSLGIVP